MKHDLTFVGHIVIEASRRDLAVSKLENMTFHNPGNEYEIPFKVKAWDKFDLLLYNLASNAPGFLNFGLFLLVIASLIQLIKYSAIVSTEIKPLYLLGCLVILFVVGAAMNTTRFKLEDLEDLFKWR